jgi:hypothetical protein
MIPHKTLKESGFLDEFNPKTCVTCTMKELKYPRDLWEAIRYCKPQELYFCSKQCFVELVNMLKTESLLEE